MRCRSRRAANVNCRIFPGVKIEDVRLALQQAAGSGVEVKLVGEPLSSDASPLRPDVLKAVTRAVHKIRPGVPVVPAQSSGATDGLVFRSVGIPTYGVDGNFMKSEDDFSHGLNERLGVQSFYDSLDVLAHAGHGSRGQAPLTVVSVNTPEPLGTFEVALRHAARLLERDAAAAAEQAAEILKVHPDQPDALALSGLALGRLGKGEEAIAALRRAVHFKPELPEAWRALGDHYSALEMREAADEAFAQHLRYSTRDPKLMNAALALVENRIPDAEGELREHLKRHPTDVVADPHAGRGGGAHRTSRRTPRPCWRAASSWRPAFAWRARTTPWCCTGRTSGPTALEEVNVLLEDEPSNPGPAQSQGRGAGAHRRTTKSPSRCTAAVLRDYPRQPKVWMSLGHALKTANQNAESIEAYRRCIELAPQPRRGVVEPRQSQDLPLHGGRNRERCARNSSATISTNDDRFHFHFTLGKALEDARASTRRRSSTTREGNALRRKLIRYDAAENAAHVDRSKRLFTREFFAARAGWGCDAPRSDLHRRIAAVRLDAGRADPGQSHSHGRRHAGAAGHHHARARGGRAHLARGGQRLSARAREVLRASELRELGERYIDADAHPAQDRRAVLHRQDAEQLRARRA